MIAAGQSIGNYRILSKIGTGGMGAVYLAEHPLIGKRVALKVIHRELAGNKEVVQRFFQEARAVNQIGNEHIVEIHDFGVTPEHDHFYIMEYLEGETLAAVLGREKVLAIMRALHIVAQIANALAAAHAAGIIHRDLKPDNIMLMMRLGDPDFVKVLDFGLAKVFAAGSAAVQTAAGVLLGTPQYMSPEACESKRDIDHRTDIYALGVLLFQLLTGKLPFEGDTMGEVLVKHVTQLPPAPRGLNPEIPPSVEQILLRCLAKPVDARFATMLALRDALLDPEAYLRGSPPIAPARSVAPGEARVDAASVVAHAASLQRTRLATGPGAGAPPPEPWQVAPTMYDGATGVPARPVLPRTGAIGVPMLAPPVQPTNQTMRIATPHGYSSRPPRKVWPIVVVMGLVIGLFGGAFAVASFGDDDDAGAGVAGSSDGAAASTASGPPPAAGGSGAPPADAGSGPPPADTGSGPPPAATGSGPPPADTDPAPAVKLVKLSIDSIPAGASVFGPDGRLLGKTPLKLDWPSSETAVAFELRLAGYRRKPTEIVVRSNTALGVELERLPRPATGRGHSRGSRGSGSGRGSANPPADRNDNGLIRPGD